MRVATLLPLLALAPVSLASGAGSYQIHYETPLSGGSHACDDSGCADTGWTCAPRCASGFGETRGHVVIVARDDVLPQANLYWETAFINQTDWIDCSSGTAWDRFEMDMPAECNSLLIGIDTGTTGIVRADWTG